MAYHQLQQIYDRMEHRHLIHDTCMLITTLTSLYVVLYKKFRKYRPCEQIWIVTYGVFMHLIEKQSVIFDDELPEETEVHCVMFIRQQILESFLSIPIKGCSRDAAVYYNHLMSSWRDLYGIPKLTTKVVDMSEPLSFTQHSSRRLYAAMIQKQVSRNAMVSQLFGNIIQNFTRALIRDQALTDFMLQREDCELRTIENTLIFKILIRAYETLYTGLIGERVLTKSDMLMLFEMKTMANEFLGPIDMDNLFEITRE